MHMRRSLARSSFFCGALLVVRSAAKPVFENCTAGGITPGWVNDAHLRVHTLTPGDPLDVLADVLIRALRYALYVNCPSQDITPTMIKFPVHGVSMNFASSMWNVVELLQRVRRESVPGDIVEAGVWRGATGILVSRLLHAANDTARSMWNLDSFSWLPPPYRAFKADKGDKHFTIGRVWNSAIKADVESVKDIYRRFGVPVDVPESNVRFVPGWFNETAPKLARMPELHSIAILRLDGDMYESTWVVLKALYHKVAVGGYIVVDDFGLERCKAAILDFRACLSIRSRIETLSGAEYHNHWQHKAYWRKGKDDVHSEDAVARCQPRKESSKAPVRKPPPTGA